MKHLITFWLALLLSGALLAGDLKLKKSKASANPPAFASFSQLLPPNYRLNHALGRLTFGARPGDLARLQQIGLKNWLEGELHPETVPENPLLKQRLASLASLDMSAQMLYAQYPPSRVAAAKNSDGNTGPSAKLADLLTQDQIQILESGTADERRQLLAGVPLNQRIDLARAVPLEQRRQLFALAPVDFRRELMAAVNPPLVVASDLTEAKLLRAVYSNHQLAELFDDFWFNHFNVFLNKGADRYLVPAYEREDIRPHVFGKFYDLLLATAQSPAMLFYLDNWQSVSPQAAAMQSARGKRKAQRGLNENYGRELLELHTLGVDGGYTQRDVIEVARCFTGWTIANPRKGGAFEYNDKMHDKGQKMVLGHIIPAGGGMTDGLEVLHILARHPSTAHFISLKLAQRFVADNPPPSLVARMAKTFLKSDGDLRLVMQP